MLQLTASEAEEALRLRSQTVILKTGRGHHRKYRPYAFTEHGALMAANILNSPRAVAMSIYVTRAFVKMREDLAANAAILKRLAGVVEHGERGKRRCTEPVFQQRSDGFSGTREAP